jgi:uncharacterized protein
MAGDADTKTTGASGASGSVSASGAHRVTADDVCAYLRDHPDFLLKHSDVLAYQAGPSSERGKGVIDLQAFMVERLRGEVNRLKEQQRELIGATRANMNNLHRIHAGVMFLLDAQSFEQLIQTITSDLAVLLDVDVISLVIESEDAVRPEMAQSGVQVVPPGRVDAWLERRDAALRADIYGHPEIYGASADLVRSEAMVRLQISSIAPPGLLAFGSREPDSFHPEQATEMVAFLARVTERVLRSWLDLPI